MDGKRIYGTIPSKLKDAMDKKMRESEYSMSEALTAAVRQWIYSPDKIYASDIVSNLPKAEQEVIVRPERKLEPLSTESIKEGPGAMLRLKEAGISILDVIHAKRAKSHGAEYNVELEKYFDLT